ncbi:MAG: pre-mRNA-splicing factor syf2 [Heterodermia speciosa]|uniref:Pre-mRNA-splicing factor SYF2 n=1 Tax=Heterodermia speciosa TaxID=116794 RepID=A0A8H3PG26_9LECA|nr:MAG: pre-mRNA-splicing factor syf2 [Heterodermia speciosa]
MPPSKKRKVAATTTTPEVTETPETEPPPTTIQTPEPQSSETAQPSQSPPPIAESDQTSPSTSAPTTTDRQARFRALQARAKTSAQSNLKAAAAESDRLATDPALLTSLSRKHAFASHNLLKADTAAAGEDFERKRAWDWTVDESEKWDKRMAKKEKHRQDVAFQDYRQDARKIYKRQLRDMAPDVEAYEREKAAAVQKAAQGGGLEIVETEDGELVAVDKSGTFYSTADSTGFVENKPEKGAVDRLVKDIQKAEETRLRKRRERGMDMKEEGDVTYINDKNKQFNQKLARFYNKYTAEIRDSFERGTMI